MWDASKDVDVAKKWLIAYIRLLSRAQHSGITLDLEKRMMIKAGADLESWCSLSRSAYCLEECA